MLVGLEFMTNQYHRHEYQQPEKRVAADFFPKLVHTIVVIRQAQW